jgi:hypothetical protein
LNRIRLPGKQPGRRICDPGGIRNGSKLDKRTA